MNKELKAPMRHMVVGLILELRADYKRSGRRIGLAEAKRIVLNTMLTDEERRAYQDEGKER